MLRIGTSGWSYKDWAGNFYPKDAKQSDWLSVYSEKFNTVEIDSTFYGIPRKTTIENWYKAVPDDFRFAAKFPKKIIGYEPADRTNQYSDQNCCNKKMIRLCVKI